MRYGIEKLIYLFENNNDVTFLVQNDLAFDLVEQLEMRGHRFCEGMTLEDVKELYESNVLMISRSESFGKENCFFEVAYGCRHLKYIEDYELVIIEEGVIEPWEIKKYIKGGYILFTYEDDEDYNTDFIDDVMIDMLYEIGNPKDGECSHDILKKYLVDMYETGRLDMLNEMMED